MNTSRQTGQFSGGAAVGARATGSEFDQFLYASIGEEDNGTLLSVLSALARLNVDPWEEASRLSRMPREAALRFVATLIAGLPDGSPERTDPQMHATRLIALLPKRVASTDHSTSPISSSSTGDRQALLRYVIFYIAVTIFLFVSQWLNDRPQGAASGTTPAPAIAPPRP
jgi:hypothetical protein